MKKILEVIKNSKAIIIVVIGILTALVAVLNTSEEVIESIPVIEAAHDSIPTDSISGE